MLEIEHYFDTFVRACILLIEIAGIAVIVISMVRGFVGYLRKDESIRIELAKGIMLGLEFKVGSEVLRSVIVSGWNELGTLAAVILLRSLLTLLLHWEISEEEKRVLEPAVMSHLHIRGPKRSPKQTQRLQQACDTLQQDADPKPTNDSKN